MKTCLIQLCKIPLEEITKYICLAKIAAYRLTHEDRKYDFSFPNGKAKEICLLYIVPIMIGLKMYNTDLYDRFVSGEECTPLIEVIRRLQCHYFNDFLGRDETYDEKESDKKLVTFEDK